MQVEATPLAVWMRRFLIVAGYSVGIAGSIQALLLPLVGWPAFDFLRLYGVLKPIYLLFLFASAASPGLLLVGIWGYHKRKGWARRCLLIYIATGIGGALGLHAVTLIAPLHMWPGGTSQTLISLGLGLIRFVDLIDPCMYPVLLLFCLMRPDLCERFADSRPGFPALLNSDSPASRVRPIPVESVELEERP